MVKGNTITDDTCVGSGLCLGDLNHDPELRTYAEAMLNDGTLLTVYDLTTPAGCREASMLFRQGYQARIKAEETPSALGARRQAAERTTYKN